MATRKQPSKKHPKPGKNDAEGVKRKLPRRKNIPKGDTPKEVKKRKKQVVNALKPLVHKKTYSKTLGRKIVIAPETITEVKGHAPNGYSSTLAAMDAVNQIKKAKSTTPGKPKPFPPKDNNTQKRLKLREIYVLEGKLGSKKTKVVFGRKQNTGKGKKRQGGKTILYSIQTYEDIEKFERRKKKK